MPWTPPVNPVPDTVITTAYAIANILDPLRWLRLMLGNSDPPGADYVPVSTGPASVAWAKVTAAVMAANAVVTHLGYTPANAAGQAFSGAVSAPTLSTTTGGISSAAGISAVATISTGAAGGLASGAGGISTTGTLGVSNTSANSIVTQGGISAQGDIGSNGRVSGASFGAIHSISNIQADGTISTISTSANSIQTSGGISAALAIATANGDISTTNGNVSGQRLMSTVSPGGLAPLVVNSAVMVNNLNAHLHAGCFASVTPSAGTIPIADASGKLDAWVTPGGGSGSTGFSFPMGVIAFIPDAALPTGFSFYTAANGRVLVGAGTAGVTNPQTFTVGTSYGPDWGHAHTYSSQHNHTTSATHTHGANALGVGGSITGPVGTNGLAAPGGTNLPTDTHTHGHTLDVTGGTDAASPGQTDSTGTTGVPTSTVIWVPPSHALNAIRRTS